MKPEEVVRSEGLYTILTKGDKVWRSDKTKVKEFGLIGVVNCRKVNIWTKPMEDKGYFCKVCLCRLKSVLSPVLRVDSSFCYETGEGGYLYKGKFVPCFSQKGAGQRVLPVTPPAQNNPFSKEAYFGVARSDPLQMYVLKYYFHASAMHFSFYSCGQITFLKGWEPISSTFWLPLGVCWLVLSI